MKYIIALAVSLVALSAYSKQTKAPTPATEKSRFVYLEFYPNAKEKVTIQSIKCDPKKNDLSVQKFTTKSKVTDGEVNVINIYARSGDCKESPYSSVWQESVEVPKNGKHTHVYITILSDNVSVL